MTLARLGQLELLPRLYGPVQLPSGVYAEVVVRGRERGHADGFLVHLAIQRGQLIVVDTETTALSSEIASLSLKALVSLDRRRLRSLWGVDGRQILVKRGRISPLRQL